MDELLPVRLAVSCFIASLVDPRFTLLPAFSLLIFPHLRYPDVVVAVAVMPFSLLSKLLQSVR